VKELLLVLCVFAGFGIACQPEEEILAKGAVRLQFEKDSVQFDTLFTSEKSITRRLRVYNPADETVLVESIFLENGAQSPYTLYVNGKAGKSFGDQSLLPGDSLLLLLEARLPVTADTLPYLANDALVVVNKSLRQEVAVVGWGQNALFLSDSVVACNSVWDSPLPYIIEKSILVDSLCSLTIAKGSRLYFKPGARLYVKGSLLARGDSLEQDRILFRNHRLDPLYENQPGQWGGIIFLPGSKGNKLSYCDIRNAEYGIYLGTPDNDAEPDLELGHCRIENTLLGGIVCYTSDLFAYNTLVNTSAQYTVANLAGGHYTYEHCTFANYFTQRENVPVLVLSDNVMLEGGSLISHGLFVEMENSIVWGNLSSSDEVLIDNAGGKPVELNFSHNLLRSAIEDFATNGNIINSERFYPSFRNIPAYDYRPDSLSPAIDAGLLPGQALDLSGKPRDSKPDIGAYEYFPEPEEDK
jgi:hypothetical protein